MAAAYVSAAPTVAVVMTGLDNPRGLAFGPEGALYVAEAGRSGPGGSGFTGAVSRLYKGVQSRVVTGLPSRLFPPANIIGPNDISFRGRGNAYVSIGIGGDPALRAVVGPAGPWLGYLARITPDGAWTLQSDIAGYEATVNPHPTVIDSNPYGVLAFSGGVLVTDAGGNSLLRVAPNGDISTLAVFPSRPERGTDSVPTSVAVGPDGAYYVGELTGVPFTPGAARIYRVVPGQAPEIYLTGFTTIMDLAFGRDGNLYVLQHSSTGPFFGGPGALIRVEPNGDRTTLFTGLERPSAFVIGNDGAFYISNKGTSIGTGEVLRLQL
jgi:hypothetical protein